MSRREVEVPGEGEGRRQNAVQVAAVKGQHALDDIAAPGVGLLHIEPETGVAKRGATEGEMFVTLNADRDERAIGLQVLWQRLQEIDVVAAKRAQGCDEVGALARQPRHLQNMNVAKHNLIDGRQLRWQRVKGALFRYQPIQPALQTQDFTFQHTKYSFN